MIHYGGDYNPEQWDESVWPEDARRMREAGVTTVSLGIFAWARIQPDEDTFDFGWLDRILDLLHEHGIAVDLATATASPPPWATSRYPGILPQDENGATYWPGSRQAYRPTSPDYRRLAARLVTAIAERYHDHPAVVLWHVNNEYACHLHHDYSDDAAAAFRVWLERKYDSIDELNRRWGTFFWSQRYASFAEIVPPRKAPYSHNPAGLLDFRRFTSDALLELYTMERDILRASGATQPITTNFMGAFPPLDYWKWAAEVDVVSDDNYVDPADPESFRTAAFTRDLMRSLKPGVPWLLMEQATGAVSWRPSNAVKAPGQMAALSMQAVGRGADGVLFFQWRQSRRGSEKFHSAMLPQAGVETRTWREVVELGRVLGALPALSAESSKSISAAGPTGSGARIALVLDWENWWAIGNPDHPVVLDFLELVQRWYSALHRQNLAVDLVLPTADLAAYDLVLLAHSYLLTDAAAENLTAFVERGGRLLVTAFSDVVDEDDAFREGGFQVGLREVLGVSVLEFAGLGAAGAEVAGAPFGVLRGELLAEEVGVLVDPSDERPVEILGRYSSGPAAGTPALTARRTGTGTAHYLATIPDDAGMLALTAWLAEQSGVSPVLQTGSPWVEAARRGDVLTVINHGQDPVDVAVSGADLLTGRPVDSVHLAPYAWTLLRP
ncbi:MULTISPECIES: beta-galactosidase [unclassified Rathayibacter]|uniref:beta-galactosidase n=1 Tax=unclassified Rathayibacter TaxID=2609250 RepID=UPI0010452982|nr:MULTISPECIES: beta-galactosidase [unclassified Rathayibacter]TCL82617.1 beta-galactosidase [Rathayibacter sp. PhB192]TCM27956.1 beta-galactosidase [Rathayibacter sp. PhB179]